MAEHSAPQAREQGTVLILAPFGQDAETLAAVVAEAGLLPYQCPSAKALCDAFDESTLALLLTEEALRDAADGLASCLRDQPSWSDVPVIMLSGGMGRAGTQARWDFLQRFGNMTVLERPMAAASLLMALRAALRSRSWQYLVRDQMRKLEEQAASLEQRVEERTQALRTETEERKRIESALQEAGRLEAIGRLTGGVAHDFNNLLQIVATSASLLRFVKGDEARSELLLTSIENATERGARMTHQLLSFGRRQALASRSLDIGRHLNEVKDLLQQSLREKIRLHLQVQAGLWHAKADVTQLDVALLNLAMNAKEAMPGGGDVTVALRNITLPSPAVSGSIELAGEYIWLAFSDTGGGMTEETARKAFEPFFTTKKTGEGAGLGLSQVYGFSRQSGGAAWLSSGEDGTTVSLLLPKFGSADVMSPGARRTATGSGRLRSARVLYVEDDDAVADVTLPLLSGLGLVPTRARNAEEALAQDASAFDLVFSDVVMPGAMDGIAMAQRLLELRPGLPIVLASGFVVSPERLAGLRAMLLRKPYTIAELRTALSDCLALYGAR